MFPPWLISLLVSLSVGVILFLLNRVTFKSSADLTTSITGLTNRIDELEKDVPTTEQRVQLEGRLTRFDEQLKHLQSEVDFTKTSHKEFLRLLERALIPVAHSPHTPELDRLLERRDEGEDLSAEEWKELIKRLDEQAQFYDDVPGKKLALRGLRAIYLHHMKIAQKREGPSH